MVLVETFALLCHKIHASKKVGHIEIYNYYSTTFSMVYKERSKNETCLFLHIFVGAIDVSLTS